MSHNNHKKRECIEVFSYVFILQLASKILDILVSIFVEGKCKEAASPYCVTTSHIKA